MLVGPRRSRDRPIRWYRRTTEKREDGAEHSARLERLNNVDQEIERLVEPRARQLERSAETLCRNMQSLDAIDDALAYRLPDGGRLDLIDARIEIRETPRH